MVKRKQTGGSFRAMSPKSWDEKDEKESVK